MMRASAEDNHSKPGAVCPRVSWWGGGVGGLRHQSLLVLLCHALSHVLLCMALSAALNECM